jgi:hypothetical protein
MMKFGDTNQQSRFIRSVQKANTFEELPEWCRKAILEAEIQREEGRETETPEPRQVEDELANHPREEKVTGDVTHTA